MWLIYRFVMYEFLTKLFDGKKSIWLFYVVHEDNSLDKLSL